MIGIAALYKTGAIKMIPGDLWSVSVAIQPNLDSVLCRVEFLMHWFMRRFSSYASANMRLSGGSV